MKFYKNFLTNEEKLIMLEFIKFTNFDTDSILNNHIKTISSGLNGESLMFDITKTTISKKLSKFQSSDNILNIKLPDVFEKTMKKVSNCFKISIDNVFLQILIQKPGGKILPHYDSSIEGYITYKCNIPIKCEQYEIFIEDKKNLICEGDLYAFEASLYKHWTEELKNERILLSWAFILPYSDLGWNELDPRIRLSKRISKYFQK